MQQDDFILDENVDDKTNKLPPPIVSFERIFFLVLLISQYFAFLQMATAKNYDVFLGLLWAGGVHILLGFWQFLSALIVWLEQRDRLRKIYLIIATIALIINTFIFLGFSNEIAVGLFLAVVPHFLAWFYWYIVFKDHKIRKNAYVL